MLMLLLWLVTSVLVPAIVLVLSLTHCMLWLSCTLLLYSDVTRLLLLPIGSTTNATAATTAAAAAAAAVTAVTAVATGWTLRQQPS
jgi:hypothetical protein